MYLTDIIGAWLAVFLTLSILSFLFKENPLFKAAEHLFVGTSAGYGVVIAYWQVIQPDLLGSLWPEKGASSDGFFSSIWYGFYDLIFELTTLFGLLDPVLLPERGIENDSILSPELGYIIPLILGILMLTRLIPKLAWMARYSIAYIVGVFAGLRAFGYLNSDIYKQVINTSLNTTTPIDFINSLILIVGTICALVYFFFSKKHEGVLGKVSKVGIYFLMVSFGASFGFTVIGRISLLIGRFDDLNKYSGFEYYYATLSCLILIVITLTGYFYFKRKKNNKKINQFEN
tara:strand:+ start:2829 stop:3692 length:864 start_codon:yes stop_codon:yes gene_type:complete